MEIQRIHQINRPSRIFIVILTFGLGLFLSLCSGSGEQGSNEQGTGQNADEASGFSILADNSMEKASLENPTGREDIIKEKAILLTQKMISACDIPNYLLFRETFSPKSRKIITRTYFERMAEKLGEQSDFSAKTSSLVWSDGYYCLIGQCKAKEASIEDVPVKLYFTIQEEPDWYVLWLHGVEYELGTNDILGLNFLDEKETQRLMLATKNMIQSWLHSIFANNADGVNQHFGGRLIYIDPGYLSLIHDWLITFGEYDSFDFVSFYNKDGILNTDISIKLKTGDTLPLNLEFIEKEDEYAINGFHFNDF